MRIRLEENKDKHMNKNSGKFKKPLCQCTVRGSVEYTRINKTEKFMQVLSDKTRLKILCLLKDNELNVKNIHEEIGVKQTLASHHLTQIKKLGLLKTRSRGTSTLYSIDKKKFSTYCDLIKDMINLNDQGGCKEKRGCK